MTVKIILTDIEGTTSSISFVKDVLFPYAAEHLPEFIRAHTDEPEVQNLLTDTVILAQEDCIKISADDNEALINILLQWIEEDKKATPLKALQGMIWKAGYENGDYKAHMYPDAVEYLQQWHSTGIPLYVYSSGSVAAQKLFFGYSAAGNLLPLFSGFFDTQMGGKREAQSYRNILSDLQKEHDVQEDEVLFLSDIKEELDAAADAGLQTCWLLRDSDIPPTTAHPAVKSFAAINI